MSSHMFLSRNKKKTLLSRAKDQFLVVTIFLTLNTVELQQLEHRWLIYHGQFELDFESLQSSSDSNKI